MKNLDRKKLEDLEGFELAIKKMYLQLADLEYEGEQHSEKYKKIVNLLLAAKDIERKKFANLGLNEETYPEALHYFTRNQQFFDVAILLETQDYVEAIRLNNLLSKDIVENDCFFSEEELNDPIYGESAQETLADRQYFDSYQNALDFNIIYVINRAIPQMPDEELKKYFIYLKHFNIYINPHYEAFFIEKLGTQYPPLNINTRKYEVPKYTLEDYDSCNRNNLTNEIVDDIDYLFESADKDIQKGPERLDFYRLLSINKARLISLQDRSFITIIEKTYNQMLEEKKEYQSPKKQFIRQMIMQMFADSYELLDSIQERKKLELK